MKRTVLTILLTVLSLEAQTGAINGRKADVSANKINGQAVPTNATVIRTDSSGKIISASTKDISAPYTCSGTANSATAETCTTNPSFTVASAPFLLLYKNGTAANTGAFTITVNGSSPITVKKQQGAADLAANDLKANQQVLMAFDGTYLQVTGQLGNTSGGGSVPSGSDGQILGYPSGSAAAVTGYFLGVPISTLLPSVSFVNSITYNVSFLGVGSYSDIYTCPTQSPQVRCAIIEAQFYFTGTSTQNCSAAMKDGGGTYHLISNTVITSNNGGGFVLFPGYILEQGQTFSTNCVTANYNIYPLIVVFNNTTPLKTVSFSSFAAADNAVYTVPTGKKAVVLNMLGMYPPVASGTSNGNPFGQSFIMNQTGVSVTYIPYILPNGQTNSGTYQVGPSTTIATNTSAPFKAVSVMNAGDSIVINSSSATAGQFWFANILEQ